MKKSLILSVCLLALSMGCSKKSNKTEVWIYSSSYKEVLAVYDEVMKKELPDIEVKWFQSGSENIASKVMAELSAGNIKADLMLTSDVFFYQELKNKGHLLKINEAALAGLPPEAIDQDKTFVISRFPVMVIAYNKDHLAPADRPKGFKDLLQAKYKGKLTMPSPMESGTAMTSVLFLRKMFGDDYFRGLRKNEVLAAGGNGAAYARVQSGEKPIAIVLLENVLQGKEKGNTSVEYIVPEEGALPIPSPLAMFSATKHPEAVQRVFAWFMGPSAQQVLLKGWNYSIFSNTPAPKDAPEWTALHQQPWTLKTFETWGTERQAVKDFFQNTVLK